MARVAEMGAEEAKLTRQSAMRSVAKDRRLNEDDEVTCIVEDVDD